MVDNGLKCPLFILDSSFIRLFLEGKMLRNRMFVEIMRRKKNDLPFQVVTTLSTFQNALYILNTNPSIQNIKFIMELCKIYPSHSNYKNTEEVTQELLKFTKLMSEGAL